MQHSGGASLRRHRPRRGGIGPAAALAVLLASGVARAQPAAPAVPMITVTGEILDTWCYLSGVMGQPDAVSGSAHHTCAVWCAAGGIPVGLRTDDGTLYMVLKLEGGSSVDGNPRILSIQANRVTARGQAYSRDGLNYLVVDRVVEDLGLVNRNHGDFGVVPPFAIPDAVVERARRP